MLSIMLPRAVVAAERIDEVIVTESSIHDADQTEAVTAVSYTHLRNG